MKNVKNRNNGNVIGDYDRPRLIKMADVFNDKGDNYLTEIPGCPEKRIKKTLTPISLLNSNENEWGVVVFIIWNRHGLECSRIWKLSGNFIKKCRDFLGRGILGTTFFRAESSLIQSSCRSFIRVIVPYEISKVNFRVETKILVSMSVEI